MQTRFTNPSSRAKNMWLIKNSPGARLGALQLNIGLKRGGETKLSGRLLDADGFKMKGLCALLYSARAPFIFEVGRLQSGVDGPVSSKDRKWLRMTDQVVDGHPFAYPHITLGTNGAFSIPFKGSLLNDDLGMSVLVIAALDYMLRPETKAKSFPHRVEADSSPAMIDNFLGFLKMNRAYLTDFSFLRLINNPAVVLATTPVEQCHIEYK